VRNEGQNKPCTGFLSLGKKDTTKLKTKKQNHMLLSPEPYRKICCHLNKTELLQF